jgi:tRNA threonylcarbamoyladenosine biosynthesis protein TsaB
VSYLLHIDTAVQTASICLTEDDKLLAFDQNPHQKDQACWLHVAIQQLFREQQLAPSQIDVVAISSGPGSYTGLRVGMAAAKGLCFALNKPLITINTLEMMAYSARDGSNALLCPMIDARRMEVFAAMYDQTGKEFLAPSNFILDEQSFSNFLSHQTVKFFGNGSDKFQPVVKSPNAHFETIVSNAKHMTSLAFKAFQSGKFADLAYSEPFYGKEFYSPSVKPIL